MKTFITLLLPALLLCSKQTLSQQIKEKRYVKMITFLIAQKQLTPVDDTSNLATLEGYVFDRVIATFGNKVNKATLYIFGSNSAHGKHYVALEDSTGIALLPTKDMPDEILSVLNFFKRNHATNRAMLKVMPTIAESYQHNMISYKPELEN